jgi:hypothetical protein
LLILAAAATPAFAAIKLTVMPEDGTNSLRFGRIGLPTTLNKEVNFRITTDEGQQYQIFQRLSSPFTNEQGERMSDDVLMSAGLPGSNGMGNLELQNAERMSYADQLIYTSSSEGMSDAFTLVYQINADEVDTSGNFSGDILYTLRPIGGSSQDEIVLRAYFDVSSELSVDMETSSGSNIVRLESTQERPDDGYVRLEFDGYRGRGLRIYQSLLDVPRDELNRPLEDGAVQFFTSGGEAGDLKFQERSPLPRGRQLIYSTQNTQDAIIVNFVTDDAVKAKRTAGDYYGKIQYEFESDNFSQTKEIDLEVGITPVFELATEFPPEGVSFEGILPTSEPQLKEVIVRVKSNLGKAYIVNQRIVGMLSNEKGVQYESEFFNVKQELIEGSSGKVASSSFVPVAEGDSALFHSDKEGSSAQFVVTYKLQPYAKMQPGDYHMAVVYSISEI